MKVYYSDTFELPLPDGHHFPIEKYRLARERLQQSEFKHRLEFYSAPAATDQQLLLVHTPEYLRNVKAGNLTRIEQRRIGFPWSVAMVERHRRSTGATTAAAQAALEDGAAVHLAGGTHHAFADRGEGFCVFNDIAVAIRVMQSNELIRTAVIVDLDVHQGNGTAAIFSQDDAVFTFSMHGERNFPQLKSGSDLDIQLRDGTTDEEYLLQLEQALATELPLSDADLVCYIAGADCFEQDRYGRLSLSKAGLAERDRLVVQACQRLARPLVTVMGGGYARTVNDVVDINFATASVVLRSFEATRSSRLHRSP